MAKLSRKVRLLALRHLLTAPPSALPERPGALMNFLTQLPHDWNISLFHYRNHGAAYGRVLVGMQVPNGDRTHVAEYLDAIGYRYWRESDNPAYRLFMA